ncbi:MAG: hypothetical protein HKO67_10830 [Flavobacteriaceae bacterium]|nr:hypothetical protein [Flavobacteriaceae bacterium]
MKRILGLALIGLTLLNCSNRNSNCGSAFFGGEVINPNNDHLILYDSSQVVDTLYLDENNRFSYSFENLEPGLFSFVHGGEYQVVLVEPSDSIMIRLNTFDFDESLVFSGKGSKKNNFLLELFIEIERKNRPMYEMGKDLPPDEFVKVLDSMRDERRSKLEYFNSKYPVSPLFEKVSNAGIDYDYFAHKEIYPFRHFGKKYTSYDMLPEGYFNFRTEINYDDEDLKDFYPYYNFLFPHFNNLAMKRYIDITRDTLFNRHSVHYNMSKLLLIDSLIGNESVKNNLLKYSTRNFLSNSSSPEECDAIYTSFIQKCSNSEFSDYITDFYKTLKKLRPGEPFPELELVNAKNEVLPIHQMINGPTVVYFWTKANKMHASDSHAKVRALKDQYPNVRFISVNVNAQKFSSWRRMLDQNNFNKQHEFMLKNPENAVKNLALYNIYKAMSVGNNMMIIHPNINLFRSEADRLIADLSNSASYK